MSALASLLGFCSSHKEISDEEASVASAQSAPSDSVVKSKVKDEEKLEVESNKDEEEDDDDEVGEDEYGCAMKYMDVVLIKVEQICC